MNLAIELSTPCNQGTNDNIWSAGARGKLGGDETSIFISFSVSCQHITVFHDVISKECGIGVRRRSLTVQSRSASFSSISPSSFSLKSVSVILFSTVLVAWRVLTATATPGLLFCSSAVTRANQNCLTMSHNRLIQAWHVIHTQLFNNCQPVFVAVVFKLDPHLRMFNDVI